MIITDFTQEHIEEALKIAKANYEEERRFVPILPTVDVLPDLEEFAENGLGVSAFEGNKMVGFLCCYKPWNNAFTTYARGTFSPIHAHGAINENREKIYKRMYQSAAEKWVKAGISSHSIGLYAHDPQGINAFFTYGFGLRCVDAIRPMEEIQEKPCSDFTYSQLKKADESEVTTLRRELSAHLAESPCFMKTTTQNFDLTDANDQNSRIFIARHNNSIIAFWEVTDSGENFATSTPDMQNICGAYCLPEYRGSGVSQGLLNFMITTLRNDGYTRLGVDFESFNPTAYGFWLKHFTAYTQGVVRRIDEKALPENMLK
ncbi:MAG: GNAT family N-acetyltransferase [Anaerocolumna aminovalerica]|uniref:GNAT family N-acetyltransferase n=1 Tax=Anaerocolumna aminovalerica TaxID=1527 RepID=UPI002906D842|nr:GNAT family N-acetyltransferase [Anaerocolumna aminovalerica]MDU6264160.1 GNAT family N-acetyltransferase [Anaerocolumna aminovalerica]